MLPFPYNDDVIFRWFIWELVSPDRWSGTELIVFSMFFACGWPQVSMHRSREHWQASTLYYKEKLKYTTNAQKVKKGYRKRFLMRMVRFWIVFMFFGEREIVKSFEFKGEDLLRRCFESIKYHFYHNYGLKIIY